MYLAVGKKASWRYLVIHQMLKTAQVASEAQIADEVFDTIRYWEGRIIVACVASNLQRVQQVLNAADRSGRKVVLTRF